MTPEVQYIGHVLTPYGLNSEPSRVRAVEEMPSPADKPALLRFLGMVNYMSKFIPSLANLTQPLRELLQENMGPSILLHRPGTLWVKASKKAKVKRKDFQLGLLDYWNTPIEEIGLSTAHMLMERRTRTKLPTTSALIEQKYPTENIKEGIRRRSENSSHKTTEMRKFWILLIQETLCESESQDRIHGHLR